MGDVFYLTSVDNHPWVIVSDPSKNPEKVLVVNFSTLRADKEQTCVIRQGEDPCLANDSCVMYKYAKCLSLQELHKLKDFGHLKVHGLLSAPLVERIQKCAADSPELDLEYADILIDQGFLDC